MVISGKILFIHTTMGQLTFLPTLLLPFLLNFSRIGIRVREEEARPAYRVDSHADKCCRRNIDECPHPVSECSPPTHDTIQLQGRGGGEEEELENEHDDERTTTHILHNTPYVNALFPHFRCVVSS